MNAVRWFLIIGMYAAMIAVCLIRFESGGLWGLIGGALGFALSYFAPGQDSFSERLGNGYVGSLIGGSLGFAGGALFYLALPHLGISI